MTLRGGIRFGHDPCPEPGCMLPDDGAAHEKQGHMSGKAADGGNKVWPVEQETWTRWAEQARSEALLSRAKERHACVLVDADAVWDAALIDYQDDREKVEPSDISVVCPDCLQHWDLVEDACGECMRHDGARWVRRYEYQGDDHSPLWGDLFFDASKLTPENSIVSASGWCAPVDTRYDL